MDNNWIVENLTNAFGVWNSKMTEMWSLLTESPQTFKGGTIWQTIVTINGGMQAIGYGLPEYYGTAVSVAIWVFSLWVLKKIRNFYIAGKETTPIEKKFDFVAFFVCFPVVTYLAPQISSYQIDGVTSGCFGIQLVWCLKLLYIQFHDPEGNTPE